MSIDDDLYAPVTPASTQPDFYHLIQDKRQPSEAEMKQVSAAYSCTRQPAGVMCYHDLDYECIKQRRCIGREKYV